MNKPILFISDLHLSPALPKTTAVFKAFLEGPAREASQLFILGDFFEYWVGDDFLEMPEQIFFKHIAHMLKVLAQEGTQIFLMHGNRDFLLGKHFEQQAQVTLIPDPFVIERDGWRIALTHGDLLCADRAYRAYRYVVRQNFIQNCFLKLSFAIRCRIAEFLRQKSHLSQSRHNNYRDASTEAVQDFFEQTKTKVMIHGHTHQPACHEHHGYVRWVLPDWDFDHGTQARGGYLQLDKEGLRAVSLN